MKLALSPKGLPMVWVEPVSSYLSWLPVPKIVLETFLCQTSDDHFGPRWYEEILRFNPRVSPNWADDGNYWRLFATGLLPGEVGSLLRWMGDGHRVPTAEEWLAALRDLERPVEEIDWRQQQPELNPRIATLLDAVARARSAETVAEQMLMTGGVMEWVTVDPAGSQWGGMGEVAPEFHGVLFDPRAGVAYRPLQPERERLAYFGMRPLWKGPE